MTKMKKLVSLMLAALMLVGMMNVANAATITVVNNDEVYGDEDANTAEDYKAYKIFDAVKVEDGEGITYKISKSNQWFSVLFDENNAPVSGNIWFTAQEIPGEENVFEIIPTTETEKLDDAKEIADWLIANKGEIKADANLVVGENAVADGYWMIESSLGTNLGLATTNIEFKWVEKNNYPGITKVQKDNGVNDFTDENVDVAIGDTIEYKVTVKVPKTVKSEITVTDSMSAGLTYNKDVTTESIAAGEGEAKNWEVMQSGDSGFTIKIYPTAAVKALAGEGPEGEIVFTFSAVVNTNALSDNVKQNKVELDYSNFHQTDSVPYETYKTGAVKVDGTDATKTLSGAEFDLKANDEVVELAYDEDNKYYYPKKDGGAKIVTGDDGLIVIRGLDEDKKYTLLETKAPAGYNLLTEEVELTLVVDSEDELDTTSLLQIQNMTGTQLPSTGGIGTTIFYAVGGLLVVLAVVLLVTKRRVGEEG